MMSLTWIFDFLLWVKFSGIQSSDFLLDLPFFGKRTFIAFSFFKGFSLWNLWFWQINLLWSPLLLLRNLIFNSGRILESFQAFSSQENFLFNIRTKKMYWPGDRCWNKDSVKKSLFIEWKFYECISRHTRDFNSN